MRKLTIVFFFLLLCDGHLKASNLTCTLGGANQILFGTYSSALIQVAPSSISLNCDAGATYTIGLGPGAHGSGVTNRLMANGTQTLSYQLFSNSSYTLNWGNSSAPTTEVSGIGQGSQSIQIFAQVPANQAFYTTANGGNYTDNVQVTLTCSNCSVISGSPASLGINLNGVAPGCGISANPLNFGSYTGSVLQATTTLQVGCTGGDAYSVSLNAGSGSNATVTTRKMMLGTNTLNYLLYTSNTYATVWGDGTSGTSTVPGTGTGTVRSLTVYGQIPAGQSPPAGTYTDTIIATLTY
jgi:spore coat protein U-like protein